jgi:hypothetical protein
MKLRHKAVAVLWGDAFIDTDDFDPKDAKRTQPVWRTTVGLLVCRNQHGIVLATDEYAKAKDGVNAKMFIPNGMIKEVAELCLQ